MKRRVTILQAAHLASKRIPNKLLERVGGVRLIDSGLELLRQVERPTGAIAILMAPQADKELIQAAANHSVEVARIGEHYGAQYLHGLPFRLTERFDWVFLSNFLLRPFLSVDHAVGCVQRCFGAARPFVTVQQHRGIVWNSDMECEIGVGETADTKHNPIYYDLAHLGYGCPASMALNDIELAYAAEPWPVELTRLEEIDIDTPNDLEFARIIHEMELRGHHRS